jgi:hypothetical protein
MGLFKKAEKKEQVKMDKKELIPSLPELPKLPELPSYSEKDSNSIEKMSPLPSFPNNSFGDVFSQYSLKEAVAGEKEEREEYADDFAQDDEMQKMQKPLVKKIVNEEIHPVYPFSQEPRIKETEPLFIRIDKFEEGSQTFDEVKKQVTEIEKLFIDLKKVKENEDGELKSFEEEIKEIKGKIENIDKTIFSKFG